MSASAVGPAGAATSGTSSESPEAGLTAPDAVSAAAVARLEGVPVEVLGERTETGSVFVLPDGTRAAAVGSGPVWVRQGGDGTHESDWAAVDLTLQASADGLVRPVAQVGDLALSGGTPSSAGPDDGVELASLTDSESGLRTSLRWQGVLPVPELSGRRATYREVRPGMDLVVEATNTGFEQFVVVKQRPAAGVDLSMPLSVQVDGAEVAQSADGDLVASDDGEVVATLPAPQMWDATADAGRAFPVTEPRPAEAGAAARMAPMPDWVLSTDHGVSVKSRAALRATQVGKAQAGAKVVGDPSIDTNARSVRVDTTVDTAADGGTTVRLRPQRAFLDDPATVYPVVIDPNPSMNVAFDTYVLKGYTNTRSTQTELDVGTYDSGTHVGRAFITFPLPAMGGAQVSAAQVNLLNYYSWSCQARQWDARNTDPANASTIWSNQPAWGNVWGSVNASHGYSSSCPGDWSSANITSLAQVWANQAASYGYVGIMAASETDNYGWKRFYSSENGSYVPTLWLTYNSAPAVPSGLKVSPPASSTSGAVVSTTTPTLSATVSDPDGGNVCVSWQVKTTAGAVVWDSGWSAQNVPSGSVASGMVPAGKLVDGGAYTFSAMACDGITNSGYSAPFTFTVDATPPGAPRVSSADYPADLAWHKDANQAGSFTFSTSPADTSVVAYQWGLDEAPSSAHQVNVSNGAAGTVSITPTTVGRHTVQVKAIDRAGSSSAQVSKYSFLVGRAGIVAPDEATKVVRRVKVAVGTNDSTLQYVKYQWRRGPDSTVIADIAAGALSTSSGQPFAAGFNPLPAAGGYTTWDAAMTLGYSGGPAQVRAALATDATGAGVTYTQWVTVTVDPDADGAATSDIGPGSVNLLTGDYKVTATDAEEFGLSVLRTTSSRDTDSGYQLQPDQLSATQRDGTYNASEFTNATATVSSATNQYHQGTTSYKVTATTSGTTDTYAAIGGDVGAMRLGLVAGATYRISAWLYVPSATGLSPGSGLGETVAVFARVGSGSYYVPAATSRPSKVDMWQQRTVDVTIPAGATEAFVRLYNGFDGATGKVMYFDDLSIRRISAPFGVAWSMGSADQTAGTAYTKITQPYDDVAAVAFATGGDVWFTTGDGQTWFPEPGAEDLKLTRTSTTSWRLTEIDGTYTDFTRAGSSGDFTVSKTAPPAAPGQARYVYALVNGLQQLTRIIAPIEPGVDGWVDGQTGNLLACTGSTPARGCEVLDLDYATATTATGSTIGDVKDQVKSVSAWVFDGAAMAKTVVAAYQYNASGQLVTVQDPRIVTAGSAALVTSYTYDSAGRLTSITPAGELASTFGYGIAGAQVTGAGDWIDPSAGRLLTVSRASLLPGTTDQVGPTNTTSVVYAVPLTTATGGPYDLGPTALATWAQSDGPTDATAVFGPQNPPGVSTATATTPGATGYGPATVHYLNASGLEVDTASPAGSDAPAVGYVDVVEYDTSGKVIRTLDATNRLLALGQLPDASTSLAQLGLTGRTSIDIATLLDTRNTYSPDGLDLLTVTGPADLLAVANDPNDVRLLRPYTVNVYDEGKPDGGTYHLVTTTTSSGLDPLTGEKVDPTTTVSGYNPVDGASPLGGSSGWIHGGATTVTLDANGPAPLTSKVLYDTRGRPVSSRMPDSTGSDAGTVTTVYYTAAVNSADAACGGHPEWAGQACTTSNAGAVTGADPTRMSTSLPVKRVTAYDGYGDPTTVVETATGPLDGSAVTDTRTTTTSYDAAGRVTAVEITGTGAGVGAPVAKTTTVYDSASGEVARVQSRDGSGAVTSEIVKTYDKLGRLVTYTDAAGGSTTTSYDRYGRPSTVTESIGTTRSYAYDDPRGYVTSMTDSVAGTVTATWGPDGQLTTETLPGDVTLTIGYDAARTPVSRTYTRTSDGTVIASDRGTLNQRGQTIVRTSDTGQRSYAYDRYGRLSGAQDTSTATGTCTSRAYTHNTHSDRLTLTSATSAVGQPCSDPATDPSASTVTSTYDSADRLVATSSAGGSSWTYDPLGRTVVMPAADGSGTVSNAFYVNDQVVSQTQAGVARTSWTLDPIQRRSSLQQDQWVNDAWADSVTKVSHYGSDSDEPAWIDEDTTLPTNVTRYVSGVDGDLAMTTSVTGERVLQLIDLHGDVTATVPVADGAIQATWTGLAFVAFDEFGNPLQMAGSGSTTGPPARYGWLGGAQRSAEALGGVILMGQRLYLPSIGRFLSVDPVPGGSANSYDYCNADPVNCTDLNGTFSLRKFAGVVAAVASVASMIPGPVGMAASAVSVVAYVVAGDKKQALIAAAGIALAAVGAGVAVAAARAGARAVESGVAAGRIAARAAPKAERALQTCNSFQAGTLVLLADGMLAPIESLDVGDLVASTDVNTGQTSAEPVLAPIVGHGDKHLVEVTTGAGTWTSTANHPIWVIGKGWTNAADLVAGDQLLRSTGGPLVVGAMRDLGWLANQTVYNLHIAGPHTYYIATDDGDALVHNASCPLSSFLSDPYRYEGASRSAVKKTLKLEGWVHVGPQTKGVGARYVLPGRKGVQVLMEKGSRSASDLLHRGPYLRISGGVIPKVRVALRGNPALG